MNEYFLPVKINVIGSLHFQNMLWRSIQSGKYYAVSTMDQLLTQFGCKNLSASELPFGYQLKYFDNFSFLV